MPTLSDYSEVSICNMALQQQGRGKVITSIDEDTQPARVMKQQFPMARDAVQRSYPWNFCKTRAELAALGTAPLYEFSGQFELPTDPWCLRVVNVYQLNAYDWRVEGRRILANSAGPLKILYLRRETDLSQADPLFVQALAARLAADTVVTLTESTAKQDALWRVYQAKLREARAVDAQEGQRDSFPAGSWDSTRYGGSVTPYADWADYL